MDIFLIISPSQMRKKEEVDGFKADSECQRQALLPEPDCPWWEVSGREMLSWLLGFWFAK